MDLELKGKKALITGASRGIGAATAERLLMEGADVIIVSRGSEQLYTTEEDLKSKFGEDRIYAEVCDCTQAKSLDLLKNKIQELWSDLDIVVANVGDGRSVPDPLPDDQQWTNTWDNNFESALYTARAFLPILKKSKGCLLFISSITGLEAFGAPVDYSTAKAAVVAMAKNMARKLARDIRVNVIAPGNVYFQGGSWDEKLKNDPEHVKQLIKSTVPMNRFGKPEEIADTVAFLCSERAAFITGSIVVVDGGQTVGIF